MSSTDVDQYWDYRAELTQTLFRWDQWQELKRADSQVAVAEATYRAAQQNLLVRVSQAYFDVLAAEDTLGAAQATLEAFSRQLEQAEKRFEVGLIAITDVQESRAAHDSATAGVIAAKRALATAQEVLRELTDKDYTSLVKPAEQMPLNKPDPQDEQAWVDLALDNNLNVVAARLNSEVASANVKVAQSGHMPTLDLFAQYGESDRDATQTNQSFDPSDRPRLGRPVGGSADSSTDQRRDRPAPEHPDLQRRRHAVARARAGIPAPRGPREARRHDALGRARDARRVPGRDCREGARAGAAARP